MVTETITSKLNQMISKMGKHQVHFKILQIETMKNKWLICFLICIIYSKTIITKEIV